MLNNEVAMATVVDERGEPLTSMAVVIEQRRLLPADKPVDGMASIVALGTSVSIHGSPEDFGESDASLFLAPRRMAAESFGSHAVLIEPAQARAFALLSGRVLKAERRTVVQTGREIVVMEARTAGGFVVTVCLDGAAHSGLPPVGGTVSGTVFMVASLDTWQKSQS